MRTLRAFLLAAVVGGSVLGQTATKTKAPPPKAAVAGSKQPAPSKSVTAKSKTTAKAAPPKRYVQQQPTPQRYREIQQALADRGFFDGPVDGNWGPGSIDALKRFQRDQSLDDDGKIGSLSLIRLGLGPQRTALAPPAAQEPQR